MKGRSTTNVTTSLRPSTGEMRRLRKGRPGSTDSPRAPHHAHNGVPRSSWYRASRRIATWHRPYGLALVAFDLIAVLIASYTAMQYNKADAGFHYNRLIFNLVAFVFLPLAWVIVLWGHG